MTAGFLTRLGILWIAGLLAMPVGSSEAAAQQQAPQAQPPAQEESAEEQQQFLEALRELLGPALEGVTSFAPDPDNPEVVKIETNDPGLPTFFANLIEEESAYTPEQTMEQIRSGFTGCRDERAGGRRTQEQVTVASFSIVCRTEQGGELQMFVITLNDGDRTQALMLGAAVQHGPGLIGRGQRLFQGLTGGN